MPDQTVRDAHAGAAVLRRWAADTYGNPRELMERTLLIPADRPAFTEDGNYAIDMLTILDTIVDAAQSEAQRTRGIRPSVKELRSL